MANAHETTAVHNQKKVKSKRKQEEAVHLHSPEMRALSDFSNES